MSSHQSLVRAALGGTNSQYAWPTSQMAKWALVVRESLQAEVEGSDIGSQAGLHSSGKDRGVQQGTDIICYGTYWGRGRTC